MNLSPLACGFALFLALPIPCQAEELPTTQHRQLITPKTTQAIDRGLTFLADQQLEDGSFGTSGYARNVAVCSLSGMAFLSSGSTPGRGPYGTHLERCVDYLLEQTDDQGFIAAPDATSRGPMYGHGFAVLFLSEAYGMADSPKLRDRLGQAVKLIIHAQNPEGGWRYQPEPKDADLSVTVCQVMALRAARNAGITVPRETIDRSIAYIRGCQNEDGGFRYTLAEKGQPSQFARSAAGVVAFTNAGIYHGPELQNGLEYLRLFLPGQEKIPEGNAFYFYGQYYAIQAMWHAGGESWLTWYPAIRQEMIARQRPDGSWLDSICAEYGTAMACIILQVPNNYLPILQR
ncbi:MAG: terpene cyclase/mutase family protein [Planctomycetes bacterium]|nr:terpene cyclase/mutase family protein [Planctomycetota bacterium]